MSDLRSRCLTAMTDAMVDEAPALFDDYAAAGLDALLGVLEENAEEWAKEVALAPPTAPSTWPFWSRAVPPLLSVLKPTTEEDRK